MPVEPTERVVPLTASSGPLVPMIVRPHWTALPALAWRSAAFAQDARGFLAKASRIFAWPGMLGIMAAANLAGRLGSGGASIYLMSYPPTVPNRKLWAAAYATSLTIALAAATTTSSLVGLWPKSWSQLLFWVLFAAWSLIMLIAVRAATSWLRLPKRYIAASRKYCYFNRGDVVGITGPPAGSSGSLALALAPLISYASSNGWQLAADSTSPNAPWYAASGFVPSKQDPTMLVRPAGATV